MDKYSIALQNMGRISYPCPHINGATIEVWNWISYFFPHISNESGCLSTLGLKSIQEGKGGPMCFIAMMHSSEKLHIPQP